VGGYDPTETPQRREATDRSKAQLPNSGGTDTKLLLGKYLEYKWQETVMAGLSGATNIAFVVISPRLAVAFVKYLDREQLKKKAALDEHMQIEILEPATESHSEEAAFGGNRKSYPMASGKLATKRLGIEADFCVLLEKLGREGFKKASKYGRKPCFEAARIRIKEDACMAKLEVSASNAICDTENAAYAKWRTMLLNEDAVRANPINFLEEDMSCSPSQNPGDHRPRHQQTHSSRQALNDKQKETLGKADVSTASFKLILVLQERGRRRS
jgi:hypothetical protein